MRTDTHSRWSRLGDYAVTGLAVGLLARRALEVGAVITSGRWSRRRLADLGPDSPASDAEPRIVCVVPLYLEQQLAADTVRFWHHLVLQTRVDQVVFVTTAKEHAEDATLTRDLVLAELAALGHPERLTHVHCAEVTRYRASQLNLAVAQSQTDGQPPAGTWIAVYNADSRPAESTFAELAQRIGAEPGTRVFQQLGDYVVPERPGTGIVAVGNAVLQTWWTRSHYFARNRRGSRTTSWRAATSPYSTFGHGEFIRGDFLADIKGFPDFAYADGLLLGWICRLRGEPIGLLASRDHAEAPRTARDLITQQTAWIRGMLNFGATVAWCRQNGHLRLAPHEVAGLRLAHGGITVTWGLSTAGLLAGIAVTLAGAASRGPTRADLTRLTVLLIHPLLPALMPNISGPTTRGPGRRLAGVAAAWPIEGLALWPALADHLRRRQQAPAKTPR
ncbi:hypothetical protein Aca07nite_87860 [Actinoplanes capillaceus]|uniref:Glycosyltransferase 2-like domain-containing protein n=1 Tax=Actinoplanes campanulatus TaxID=113559 RepID=A0ABQ3WZ05_9ACTN|nr:glycosyltransferase family 2 protein [Actinoplanes capillaceus]GID51511.1 hypothetical protein Aca07nite_87860 [Actinoplanes capillaceus]